MSEMFTKCNGFIVSGDPLVYADSATMTGQGTVSEPFGVKSTDLFVQEPLYTGTSGNSAYIGWRPDETVLWSGEPTTFTSAFTANETIANFDRIRVSQMIFTDNEYLTENHDYNTEGILLTNKMNVGFTYVIDNGWKCWGAEKYHITNGTDFIMARAGRSFIGPNTTAGGGYNDTIQSANGWIYKIVGVNRKV